MIESDPIYPDCPETGKPSFKSKKEALRLPAYGIKGQLGFLGAYKCKYCPYWHQTKQH